LNNILEFEDIQQIPMIFDVVHFAFLLYNFSYNVSFFLLNLSLQNEYNDNNSHENKDNKNIDITENIIDKNKID
jgi:hypothetical protein